MIGIYKITNKLNGKSYIGQSIHCGKRLDEHCSNKKQFIDETIELEGIQNFTFEILEECNKEELNEREDYYIEKYNTMFPNGYNKRWNISKNSQKKQEVKREKEPKVLNTDYYTIYCMPECGRKKFIKQKEKNCLRWYILEEKNKFLFSDDEIKKIKEQLNLIQAHRILNMVTLSNVELKIYEYKNISESPFNYSQYKEYVNLVFTIQMLNHFYQNDERFTTQYNSYPYLLQENCIKVDLYNYQGIELKNYVLMLQKLIKNNIIKDAKLCTITGKKFNIPDRPLVSNLTGFKYIEIYLL